MSGRCATRTTGILFRRGCRSGVRRRVEVGGGTVGFRPRLPVPPSCSTTTGDCAVDQRAVAELAEVAVTPTRARFHRRAMPSTWKTASSPTCVMRGRPGNLATGPTPAIATTGNRWPAVVVHAPGPDGAIDEPRARSRGPRGKAPGRARPGIGTGAAGAGAAFVVPSPSWPSTFRPHAPDRRRRRVARQRGAPGPRRLRPRRPGRSPCTGAKRCVVVPFAQLALAILGPTPIRLPSLRSARCGCRPAEDLASDGQGG
jgi:hypothetical protein